MNFNHFNQHFRLDYQYYCFACVFRVILENERCLIAKDTKWNEETLLGLFASLPANDIFWFKIGKINKKDPLIMRY